MEPCFIILPFLVFLVSFAVLWIFICVLLSSIGGWKKLASVYRYEGRFSGRRWRFRSCRMSRYVNYNNCLIFGAGTEGLYINILPLFRIQHPPLLIPWSEIKTEKTKGMIFAYWKLSFARASNTEIRLSAALAEQIFDERNWRESRESSVVYRAYKKIEPH